MQVEPPLPPCHYGLFFHIYDKLSHFNPDSRLKPPSQQVIIHGLFNPKLLKKAKQEVMRRYHPDKHSQQHLEALSEQFVDDINEICCVANKVYEGLLK
jgi:hypothetical protein